MPPTDLAGPRVLWTSEDGDNRIADIDGSTEYQWYGKDGAWHRLTGAAPELWAVAVRSLARKLDAALERAKAARLETIEEIAAIFDHAAKTSRVINRSESARATQEAATWAAECVRDQKRRAR